MQFWWKKPKFPLSWDGKSQIFHSISMEGQNLLEMNKSWWKSRFQHTKQQFLSPFPSSCTIFLVLYCFRLYIQMIDSFVIDWHSIALYHKISTNTYSISSQKLLQQWITKTAGCFKFIATMFLFNIRIAISTGSFWIRISTSFANEFESGSRCKENFISTIMVAWHITAFTAGLCGCKSICIKIGMAEAIGGAKWRWRVQNFHIFSAGVIQAILSGGWCWYERWTGWIQSYDGRGKKVNVKLVQFQLIVRRIDWKWLFRNIRIISWLKVTILWE